MLLSLFFIIGGIWGFIELADEVKDGDTTRIDESILRFFRNPDNLADAIGPVWFEEGVRDITALGGITVLAIVSLSVAGFLAAGRKYHALVLLLGALAGGLLLNLALKTFFDRPRPALVPHLDHVSTQSFPSGHSLLSAVVYLTLGALLARLIAERRLKILQVIGGNLWRDSMTVPSVLRHEIAKQNH